LTGRGVVNFAKSLKGQTHSERPFKHKNMNTESKDSKSGYRRFKARNGAGKKGGMERKRFEGQKIPIKKQRTRASRPGRKGGFLNTNIRRAKSRSKKVIRGQRPFEGGGSDSLIRSRQEIITAF